MIYSRPHMFFGVALMAAGAIMLGQQGCRPSDQPPTKSAAGSDAKTADGDSARQSKRQTPEDRRKELPPAKAWKSLFDGRTLAGWKTLDFGGEGKVYVENGTIVMEQGANMTGITWTGKVVRNNYELSLEGMKLDGSDFFCTTTFPVGDDSCSLVVGGWGGAVVGLSNVDSHDAVNNPTTKLMSFTKGRWYRIRIRVTDAAVEAWIDDEPLFKQARKGHKFGIRVEVDLCRPLGICTWATKGAVRNIQMRPLEAGKEAVGNK